MNYSQPAKYNRFQNTMEGFKNNVPEKDKLCECHSNPGRPVYYNSRIYKGCYHCKERNYECCKRREFQV